MTDRIDLDTFDDVDWNSADPAAIFGSSLEVGYRTLRRRCHPDLFPESAADRARAEAIFRALETLYRASLVPDFPLKSPKRTYSVGRIVATGDAADLRAASCDGKAYLIKISRVPGGHAILDRERESLTELLTVAAASTYSHYLPTLVESFPLRDKIPKRANVFVDERDGLYSLERVHARHAALEGRTLAWIFKRLLGVLGLAHRSRVVHGAVTPGHVLIRPSDHGLVLVGWGQSLKAGGVLTSAPANYLPWYPPEIRAKKPAGPQADLYMAAKCMVYLAGGDPAATEPEAWFPIRAPMIPVKMSMFLRSCLLESPGMRPDDAWKLQEDFSAMLKGLYGPAKFHPLTMP